MKVRLISKEEVATCNEFHNRMYRRDRSIEQWKWDFENGLFDSEEVPFAVVDDNGRIAGTQAFIPVPMIDRDGVFWTAKSEETLVDPEYRGKKLFEQMYRLLFDFAEKHNLLAIWGFTAAHKAFDRLGFKVPGKTGQLLLPLRPSGVSRTVSTKGEQIGLMRRAALNVVGAGLTTISRLRLSLLRPETERFELRHLESSPAEAGDLCGRFVNLWGGTTIYRDQKYLQWRLFNNPYQSSLVTGVYQQGVLAGWSAFSPGDDGLVHLVDLFVAPPDENRRTAEMMVLLLLRDMVFRSRNLGAHAIRGWFVNNHPFDRLVRRQASRLGFVAINRGHEAVLYDSGVGRRASGAGDFDSWYVTRIFTEGTSG